MLIGTEAYGQGVAYANRFGGFDPGIVDMHFAAFDRIHCERPCFKKTRSPQPLVYTQFVRVVVIHVGHSYNMLSNQLFQRRYFSGKPGLCGVMAIFDSSR